LIFDRATQLWGGTMEDTTSEVSSDSTQDVSEQNIGSMEISNEILLTEEADESSNMEKKKESIGEDIDREKEKEKEKEREKEKEKDKDIIGMERMERIERIERKDSVHRPRQKYKLVEDDSENEREKGVAITKLPDRAETLPKLKRTSSQQRHIGKRIKKKTQRGRAALTQSSSVSSITVPQRQSGRDGVKSNASSENASTEASLSNTTSVHKESRRSSVDKKVQSAPGAGQDGTRKDPEQV